MKHESYTSQFLRCMELASFAIAAVALAWWLTELWSWFNA
jgi:hypothetical protein